MSPVCVEVVVVGEGLLPELVCSEFSNQWEVTRLIDLNASVPKKAKLITVLQDDELSPLLRAAEDVQQQFGIPWISGFVSHDTGIVGPLVRPGTPGCSRCTNMRRQMAGRGLQMSDQQMMMLMHGGNPQKARASRTALLQMACLLSAEAARILEGSVAHTEGRIYAIDLNTLNCSLHRFMPDPLCPVCGHQPEDVGAAALISLRPSPKLSPDNYRCRRLDDFGEAVVADYLDHRTGLVNGKRDHLVTTFADVTVNVPLFAQVEVTAGRMHSYAESKVAAILEGLERYCGLIPRGKRTLIHDSYRNLQDQALHPLGVGVYGREQYAQPDFPFKPFQPDQAIDWVWGHSFLHNRPILVPQQLAYYSTGFGDGFVNEGSNGCALGGTLEEAIFYGILEVVERDSFLMTWYARLPVPRLDCCSANDKQLTLMIDRFQAMTGYNVQLFNTTTENGIPSVWALAKNSKSRGMNLMCGAGAHLDPVKAVKSAIHEISGMLPMLNEHFEESREQYEPMLDDSSLVQRMEEHSMLYGLPQAEKRLQFLLDDSRPVRTFQQEFKPAVQHTDLTEDLRDMIAMFRRLNLDVIVIDQTAPEMQRNGLHCVKVLIPGMLPMTFGHHLTRLTGLSRVLTVPMELGYTEQRLTFDRLNPYPHPFP